MIDQGAVRVASSGVYVGFAAAGVALGVSRSEVARAWEVMKSFPLPESAEQAFSQVLAAYGRGDGETENG